MHVYPTAAGDYTPFSLDFTVRSDQMGVVPCIFLTTTDDSESEPRERFFITMTTGISRVKTADDTPLIVNDDDRKLCL